MNDFINICCISPGGHGGISGGVKREILEFNQETESWSVIGAMKEGRYNHGVSLVSIDDYKKWCN